MKLHEMRLINRDPAELEPLPPIIARRRYGEYDGDDPTAFGCDLGFVIQNSTSQLRGFRSSFLVRDSVGMTGTSIRRPKRTNAFPGPRSMRCARRTGPSRLDAFRSA